LSVALDVSDVYPGFFISQPRKHVPQVFIRPLSTDSLKSNSSSFSRQTSYWLTLNWNMAESDCLSQFGNSDIIGPGVCSSLLWADHSSASVGIYLSGHWYTSIVVAQNSILTQQSSQQAVTFWGSTLPPVPLLFMDNLTGRHVQSSLIPLLCLPVRSGFIFGEMDEAQLIANFLYRTQFSVFSNSPSLLFHGVTIIDLCNEILIIVLRFLVQLTNKPSPTFGVQDRYFSSTSYYLLGTA